MIQKTSSLYQPRRLAIACLILVLAFVKRIDKIQTFKDRAPEDDGVAYHAIAHHLLGGQGFTQDGIHPTAKRPPLYPLFLAGVYRIFGENPQRVREVQAFLGALTASGTFLLGCLLFGRWTGILGGLFMAVVYPDSLVPQLLTETFFGFLLLCLAFSLYTLEHSRKIRHAFLCGLILGLLLLHRAESILILSILPFWFFRRTWKVEEKWKKALWIYGISLALLFPWILRNWIQFRAVIPTSTLGGITFYASNRPDLYGSKEFRNFNTDINFAWPSHALSEVEEDRLYYREAFRNILGTPLKTLKILLLKILLFLNPLGEVGFDYFWGPIVLGCLLALFLTRPSPGFDTAGGLLALLFMKTLIFYTTVRFITPFLPFFVLCAFSGYTELWKTAKGRASFG